MRRAFSVALAASLSLATLTTTTLMFAGEAGAAQVKSRNCKPVEVAVHYGRLHVKCAVIKSQAYTGDIPYYAMNLKEGSAKVGAVMALLVEAKRSGRTLRIWADFADYKSVPGCNGGDCRKLVGVALK